MTGGAILGIDPGTRKVGYALITGAETPPLALGIEPFETLDARLEQLTHGHPIRAIALGRGTHATELRPLLERLGAPIHLVDETDSSYRARALYFADHPPRGWRRLIPLGMQLPAAPIDDYAALIIARRFASLEVQAGAEGSRRRSESSPRLGR